MTKAILFLNDLDSEINFVFDNHIPRRGDYISFDDGTSYQVTRVEWSIDDDLVYLTLEREGQ